MTLMLEYRAGEPWYLVSLRVFVFPSILTPDTEHGGFVVTFPAVPEAITQGNDVPEALHQAADCLEEAIAGRIRRRESIPKASAVEPDQYAICLPVSTAAKGALYLALQQAKITQSELAERLRCDEQEVSHMLDPRRTANVSRLESALGALGYQLLLGLQILDPPSSSGPSTAEGTHDMVVTSSRTA
jgi:antitoxin HicB